MTRDLTLPLTRTVARELRQGEEVRLSGEVLTGRDQACARLYQMIQDDESLPVELLDSIMFFVGPTPPPPGHVIGSAGPTTSARMVRFLPTLVAGGLRGFIGKGYISEDVKLALGEHGAIYFGAIGGTGALLSQTIEQAQVIAFEELETEAIRKLTLKDFPAVVLCDAHGGDLYAQATEGRS